MYLTRYFKNKCNSFHNSWEQLFFGFKIILIIHNIWINQKLQKKKKKWVATKVFVVKLNIVIGHS